VPVRRIPLFHPAVDPACFERVRQVLSGRWIGQGALIDEFERAVQAKLGLGHLVAVNNAASALRLALAIAGVGPGDEVVTTAMTCTMTNHPILEQFARPVFADVQEETGNLDPADVERRVTERTRAILCAHWGGTPCDLEELARIAARACWLSASAAETQACNRKPRSSSERFDIRSAIPPMNSSPAISPSASLHRRS